MKVTDVVCHILSCKVDKPFVSARGWVYGTRSTCLVEITTDEGITGWGECYGPSAVAKTFVETQFKGRVVGRDPFDVEAIWEDLYNRIKDYGTTGMAISAISGIDIALWDIMGRAVNKPVHKLIGGAFRTEVIATPPASTSSTSNKPDRRGGRGGHWSSRTRLQGHQDEDRPGQHQARGLRAREGGARGDRPRHPPGMVDANHCLLGAQRHPPRPHAGGAGHRVVRGADQRPRTSTAISRSTRALDMAVAGGENEFTRWGFRDAIVRKAMDIVQPDLCARPAASPSASKIATLASTHGVECVPHAWGSAVGHRRYAAVPRRRCRTSRRACSPFDAADAGVRADARTRSAITSRKEPIVQEKRHRVKIPTGPASASRSTARF
jgi:D-galactarolactone cycloisomerase